MRRSDRFPLVVTVLVSVTACLVGSVWDHTPAFDRGEDRREFDAPDAADRYDRAKREPLSGSLNTAARYDAALQQLAQRSRFSSRISRELPTGRLETVNVLDTWTSLGPGNIGGRTRVIAYHPTEHHVLFAAGVSGGIWKSDDNGITWRVSATGLVNIAVNTMAIDPQEPRVMYAGTGEGYFREEIRGTGLPLRGGGVFISRDGGTAWQRLAATNSADFYWVNDLELGVGDSRIVYAATRTGVWRSRNRTDDVLFASCGSYEQATVYRISRANEDARIEDVLEEPGMGRTSLAIAPSNPNVIYARRHRLRLRRFLNKFSVRD